MVKLKILFISMMSVGIFSGCATTQKKIPEYPNLSKNIEKVREQQKQLAQQGQKESEAYEEALVQKYNEAELIMAKPIQMKVRILGDKNAVLASVSRYEQTGSIEPILTHDNVVKYPFGLTKAKMICATLRVCSIELQEGELIKDVLVGDSERWNISFANSGIMGKTQHKGVIFDSFSRKQLVFSNLASKFMSRIN